MQISSSKHILENYIYALLAQLALKKTLKYKIRDRIHTSFTVTHFERYEKFY